jgi:hypothetical protein
MSFVTQICSFSSGQFLVFKQLLPLRELRDNRMQFTEACSELRWDAVFKDWQLDTVGN